MDSLHVVKKLRERIIRDLLPDTCRIYPKSGANKTIVGGVLVSDNPVARQWRGREDIPCRADLSRAFRPDRLKVQMTEVDEYNLELPWDVVVEPSDLIHILNPHTNVTEIYQVRKRKNISAFDGTIECTIAVPGATFDAHA